MPDGDSVYRDICESMTSGVVVIGGDGVIRTFNQTASTILDLERDAVVGRNFAEVFLANAAFDELNEAMLAAIYDGVVGHQRVVNVTIGGNAVPLAVATSYLRGTAGGQGSGRTVVAVFSDVSEVQELKARESELALDLESKHEELRSAYRDLEQRNSDLDTLLRRVQVVRAAAAVFVAALIFVLGAYVWSGPGSEVSGEAQRRDGAGAPGAELRLATVERQAVSSMITMPGEIRPRGEVAVTSPISGQVGTLHVKRGQRVREGQLLLDLDVTQVEIQGRKARAAFLTAKAKVEELNNWSNSLEVSRARRAVTKARIALEAANTKVEETAFLVERGLVPSANKDSAERELRTRSLDLETAEQDLEAVLAKGSETETVAGLELENAEAELARVDWALRNATITAPIAGVVVSLQQESAARGRTLSAGASIQAGQHLLTIGDMAGLTVTGRVDEIDVGRVRPGDKVRVTGPAFEDIELEGVVAHVSSQASSGRIQQGVPRFEVTALVDALDERQREAVRLGMSAEMDIILQRNDNALVAPVGAVTVTGGKPRVRVWDEAAGSERIVEVEVGITTLDHVEILGGVALGDRLVLQ